jgi:hypothetical protein
MNNLFSKIIALSIVFCTPLTAADSSNRVNSSTNQQLSNTLNPVAIERTTLKFGDLIVTVGSKELAEYLLVAKEVEEARENVKLQRIRKQETMKNKQPGVSFPALSGASKIEGQWDPSKYVNLDHYDDTIRLAHFEQELAHKKSCETNLRARLIASVYVGSAVKNDNKSGSKAPIYNSKFDGILPY